MAAQASALTLTWNNGTLTNPGNIVSIDSKYATCSTNTTNNTYQRWTTNAASLLPVDAVVLGYEVTVRGRVSTTAPNPRFTVGPGLFGASGTQSETGFTTTDTTYVIGGPTNPLGATDRASLADFSVRHTQSTTTSTTWYWDFIGVKVYWDVPSGANALFLGELF